MLFSHRVIKMAWAHRAQPPFHKEGALAHKALEEGGDGHGMKPKYCGYDGHVSQLFIFMHAGARSRRTRGRRGARRRIQDKADPPSWSATADRAFEVVVGSMPPLAPSPWSTAPSPVVIVVLRVADEACSISRNLRSGGMRAPSVLSLQEGHQDERTERR